MDVQLGFPYETDRAMCACNNVTHNHPEVTALLDWEADWKRAPETVVTAGSIIQQPGGGASVGTDWALLCFRGGSGKDASCVPVRLATFSHSSPASAVEHHTCWLGETGRPTRDIGTLTRSLSARTRWGTGSYKRSASWAWCTDGKHRRLTSSSGSPSPCGHALCVLATPWLCSAQRQQIYGKLT